MSVFFGHSPNDEGNVAHVLNINTGHVSLQFHLVVDDNFFTVENLKLGTFPTNWDLLVQAQCELEATDSYHRGPTWTTPGPDTTLP